jgi:hypothetical protein
LLASAIASCANGRPTPSVAREAAPPPAAAGGVPRAPRAPEGSLESRESKTVAKTLARVSQLRGVGSRRPVPGVKLDRAALVGRIKEKALREFPADALRREGQILELFGFAPASFDYLGELMTLLEAQLEGFYEPENGTMYLAADLRGPEAQATLAHELVHALQDQSWDLKSRSSYRPGKGDETLALACLAEGDATSLMMDFMLAGEGKTALDLPDPMLRELMANGMEGAAIQDVPHILRTTLIAPYVEGVGFVHALRRKGGWAMVSRAWTEPPTTTEQVLHVEKWERREPALPVPTPTARALGGAFRLDDEDTWGELGFALAFEEWLDHDDARAAARGWGGDRAAVYTHGDELAFAVHERYDDVRSAERGFVALAPRLKKRLGRPAIDAPGILCFERSELGPLLVARKGSDFVLTAGPTRAPKGAPWTSTSTCAQAMAWADEIVP